MSTRKVIPHKTPAPSAGKALSADDVVDLPAADLDNIEVTALELDEEFNTETDPYNRTGQFLVGALRRKQD